VNLVVYYFYQKKIYKIKALRDGKHAVGTIPGQAVFNNFLPILFIGRDRYSFHGIHKIHFLFSFSGLLAFATKIKRKSFSFFFHVVLTFYRIIINMIIIGDLYNY